MSSSRSMEESVFQYIHTEEKVLDRAEETYSLIKKYAATDAAL